MMTTRTLGRSGIAVSPLGMGCWAIGGPFYGEEGQPYGWGEVDDEESLRAVRRALELGVTFFDTADVYGTGHSERLLGQALRGHRDQVVLATKWSKTFDEQRRVLTGVDTSPAYLRRAVEASLRRLETECIDLYQLHHGAAELDEAAELLEALEELVSEGKIRWYGWSTDDPSRASAWGRDGAHCTEIGRAHV